MVFFSRLRNYFVGFSPCSTHLDFDPNITAFSFKSYMSSYSFFEDSYLFIVFWSIYWQLQVKNKFLKIWSRPPPLLSILWKMFSIYSFKMLFFYVSCCDVARRIWIFDCEDGCLDVAWPCLFLVPTLLNAQWQHWIQPYSQRNYIHCKFLSFYTVHF